MFEKVQRGIPCWTFYFAFKHLNVTFLFKWQKFSVINDKSYQFLVAFYIPITKLSLAASTTSTVILSI